MSAAPILQNPLFDKKLINAFIEGVVKTMSTMASTEVKFGKPFVDTKSVTRGAVAGMVGMVAPPMRGTLVISFPKDAIFLILENMLGEKHAELTSAVSDAVGELTNMIYGSAKTTLNQLGYNFEMAIPSVVQGDFIINRQNGGATLVIPFDLQNKSQFFIEIAVS